MSKAPSFLEITPSSWPEAKQIGQTLSTNFVYRGHSGKSWHLRTTIERAADQFGFDQEYIQEGEKIILQKFKSRAHHYLQSPPNDTENVEWLSLIQDYGGPTRLLDFTESFYIASFFAIESATEDACIWAVNTVSLSLAVHNQKYIDLGLNENDQVYLKSILRLAESFIDDSTKCSDLVLKVIPPRLNERLAIQKGVFLFPCNPMKSFEGNLCNAFGFSFDSLDSGNAKQIDPKSALYFDYLSVPVLKMNLSKIIHLDAIRDLYSMNIDAASLFPGLDGFAKSLKFSMPAPGGGEFPLFIK